MIRRMLLGFALLGLATAAQAQPAKDAPFRVGMAKTFFNDVPEVLIGIAVQPFPDLLKQTTGLKGELSTSDDPIEVAKKLDAGEVQIGVFHGHELAWAQQKYPKLTPLMVVTNKLHEVRVVIVVPTDSPVKSFASLRGKNFDLPLGSKEHTCAYAVRNATDNAQSDAESSSAKSRGRRTRTSPSIRSATNRPTRPPSIRLPWSITSQSRVQHSPRTCGFSSNRRHSRNRCWRTSLASCRPRRSNNSARGC